MDTSWCLLKSACISSSAILDIFHLYLKYVFIFRLSSWFSRRKVLLIHRFPDIAFIWTCIKWGNIFTIHIWFSRQWYRSVDIQLLLCLRFLPLGLIFIEDQLSVNFLPTTFSPFITLARCKAWSGTILKYKQHDYVSRSVNSNRFIIIITEAVWVTLPRKRGGDRRSKLVSHEGGQIMISD